MNYKILFTLVALLFTAGCFNKSNTSTETNQRVIHADVVALDQDILFNRFGSHDPYGMVYALKRDVVSSNGTTDALTAGKVKLRSDKRPRPLVLRANENDILEVSFTNLLNPNQPELANEDQGEDAESQPIPSDAAIIKAESGNPCAAQRSSGAKDSPKTRCASIAMSGLTPIGDANDGKITGLEGIPPGETITYRWQVKRKGTYLFSSLSAPSGGQGDGGSLVHGLFGTLNVEAKDSNWYRSAVKESDLSWPKTRLKLRPSSITRPKTAKICRS